MKKRLLAVLMAIAAFLCVFGFSACGDSTDQPKEPNETNEPSVIAVTEVKLDKENLSLKIGEEETLTATVLPNDATDKTVTWKSSEKQVATVENGKVTAVKAGTATITATAGGKSASCSVTVTAKEFTEFVMPVNGFDTTKQVEITLYHTMGLQDVFEEAYQRFNKLYPNIKVQHTQVGSYDDVYDRIISAIPEGEQPNIAFCYPYHVADYNGYGAVQALDEFLPESKYSDMKVTHSDGTKESLCLTAVQEDDFVQASYEDGRAYGDNKMYTLPFSKTTEVMYYNKTFFDRYNLTPPTTWDETWELCEKIKMLDPQSVPLGYDSEANAFITLCEQYGADYTSIAEDDHYLFDNATARGFVQEFKTAYDNGYLTTMGTYGAYTSTLFDSQGCYMSIGSSASASYYGVSGAKFEVGIVPVPQKNPDKPKCILQGPSLCIFKQDDPQKVLASWLLVKFLTTDVYFQTRYSVTSGYLPVSKTVQAVYGELFTPENGYDNLTFLSLKVCAELGQAYFVSPAFAGSGKAREEVGKLMLSVLKGEKTLDEAFKNAIANCQYYDNSKKEI